MITLEISWEEIKFFFALVIAGSLYGWHCYMRGKKVGWDDSIYALESAGFLYVTDDGRVERLTDREFEDYQEEMEYSE